MNLKGNYLYKEVSLGSIGIDITGKPNISMSAAHSTLETAVTVRKVRK